ncbi:Galactose-3-O-sulfotransferase 3 [Holothuria leucospilota]|uniref:Galactose-3-O-sulfotransferase 3 n=1 Tax=Holothuria leucospilota TaxID=206669 RepID=A0A9Q1BDL4_HOLLE|nr:Galactose-3-O-sulfotransferase 3 [Holothuria leucospilota]
MKVTGRIIRYSLILFVVLESLLLFHHSVRLEIRISRRHHQPQLTTLDRIVTTTENSSREQNASLINHQLIITQSSPLVTLKYPSQHCKDAPVGKVAYIRTHKTGSTTLTHIVNQYGLLRNLSFCLPKSGSLGRYMIYNVTKAKPKMSLLKPLNSSSFNESFPRFSMFTLHTLYDRQGMEKVMEPNSRYITSVRDPVKQFRSAFVYYGFENGFPDEIKKELKSRPIAEKLKEWFRNATSYQQTYKLKNMRGEPRYYYTRNSQINDLGYNMKYIDDKAKISKYISKLAREFDVVLITEHFDESLLLMKKELCWDIEDILYFPKNIRFKKSEPLPPEIQTSIREWNFADLQLFEHFNRTLWTKIRRHGPSFETELIEFKSYLKELGRRCGGEKQVVLKIARPVERNVTIDCHVLKCGEGEMFEKLRKRQYRKQ